MSHGAQVGILKANTAVKRQSLKGENLSADRVCLLGSLGKWGTGLILTKAFLFPSNNNNNNNIAFCPKQVGVG
jgi:hypothetical protein